MEYQISPSDFGPAHKAITGIFTDEGNKYIVGIVNESKGMKAIRVKAGFVESGEVTGIVERRALNMAEVLPILKRQSLLPLANSLAPMKRLSVELRPL